MSMPRVGVVGSAQTELRPAWSGAQHIDLISAVVAAVFKGTGLTLDDVDFVIDSGSDVLDGRSISNCGFLGALGAHHKEEARVEEDGLSAALYGVNKIRSGASSIGLIVAYSKPSESDTSLYWAAQCEPFYQRPVGFGQAAANGIQAQRYLAANSVSEVDLARIVRRRWSDAKSYGRVAIEELPDEDKVLSSPMVAYPLRELMVARPVDGAVAVLIARGKSPSELPERRCGLREWAVRWMRTHSPPVPLGSLPRVRWRLKWRISAQAGTTRRRTSPRLAHRPPSTS